MPTGALSPIVRWQATKNGVAAPGAQLVTALSGGNTPQSVYTTSALSVAHANPVIADAAGLFPVMYLAAVAYRMTMLDAAGATIMPAQDNVYDFGQTQLAATTGASQIGFINSPTGSVATTVETKLREWLSLKADFGAVGDGTADDTSKVQAWLSAGVATGRPLRADPGEYKLTATVTATIGNDNTLTISGAGKGLAGFGTRFILDGNLATNDTPLIHINGASQSAQVSIEGIQIDGVNYTGTGIKVSNLSAAIRIHRSWVNRFLGRGVWLYACIGIDLDNLNCETSDTNLEIGGVTSIGEGAIVACKFKSALTRNVHLNTGCSLISFVGGTIYGEAAPAECIGVEFADDVFGIGFREVNFENSTPALYSAGLVKAIIAEGCTFNARNLTGAGTKYNIDFAESSNCRITHNVFTGACDAGGTLVGIRSADSDDDVFQPNQFDLTGAGTLTEYVIPSDASPLYGIGISGNTVPLLGVRRGYFHTQLDGDIFDMTNDQVVVLARMYAGTLQVTAGPNLCKFDCSNGVITEIVGADAAAFTTTKDNPGTFNAYYETAVVKIQNRSGGTIAVQTIYAGRR